MEYKEVRRKPPPNISERERKLYKSIMKRAWYHDRNFCGCTPIDLGCGMISIVTIFPIIGAIIAYKMHYKMIKMCHQAGCPNKIKAKMVSNIGIDLAISLVPLLGVLFSWMKASSTRNAALFDTWIRKESVQRMKAQGQQGQRVQQGQQLQQGQRPGQRPGQIQNQRMQQGGRPNPNSNSNSNPNQNRPQNRSQGYPPELPIHAPSQSQQNQLQDVQRPTRAATRAPPVSYPPPPKYQQTPPLP